MTWPKKSIDTSADCRGLRRKRKDADLVLWRRDRAARQRVVKPIVSVLKEMWNQRHEIPLIACFRKEVTLRSCSSCRGLDFHWRIHCSRLSSRMF